MIWNNKNNQWVTQTQPPIVITDADEIAALSGAVAKAPLTAAGQQAGLRLDGHIINGTFYGNVTAEDDGSKTGVSFSHRTTIALPAPAPAVVAPGSPAPAAAPALAAAQVKAAAAK